MNEVILNNQDNSINKRKTIEYSFPDEWDYRTASIYFGQVGSFIEILVAQLEPTPYTEIFAPIAGAFVSGGVTITVDKFGRWYIAPGLSLGRTLVSHPLGGIPSISFTQGYLERGEKFGPEGNATREELDKLLCTYR